MATPYDANNTGGTLPLPRVHIPTWFTINSVSEYSDALLDLGLFSNENNIYISINDTTLDLSGPSTSSNNEYDLFYIVDGQTRFSQTFGGYYKENGTITGSYTGQWTCTFLDYSSSTFAYRLYFIVDGSAVNKLYTGNKKTIIDKSPLKIISPEKLLDYIINESSFSSLDINAYPSRNALLAAVSDSLPTGISADVMKNEEYFDDQSLLLAFGDRLQEEITIGNIVPKLGSIIAYSDATDQEFLPDTNSSHILYFKNAELKSFNFAVQNNTVIDRIEKLYRYAGPKINPTTEFELEDEDPDVDPKNMIINEETANVPENTEILMLTEGSVVTSV